MGNSGKELPGLVGGYIEKTTAFRAHGGDLGAGLAVPLLGEDLCPTLPSSGV